MLAFRLRGKEWTFPVDRVRQVLAPRPITRVPGADTSLLGLISWQGHIIPVLGLGRDGSGPLIVIEDRGALVAVATDEIDRLIPADAHGQGDGVPPLLDVERI
jgi:chemotaxis signal transduction protein